MPRPISRFAVCAWLLVGTAGGTALAQGPAASPEPVVPEKAGKELHAFRIRGAAPRIDGRLDDEVWNNAQALYDAGDHGAADEALNLWATQVPDGHSRLPEARAELRAKASARAQVQ